MTDAPTTPTPGYPPPTPQPMTTATPVPPAPTPSSGQRRGWGAWIALTAVLALLIGAGIGYAASMPAKNDAVKQRDAANTQVTQLQSDLTQAQSDAKAATNAKDKCSKAATDAKDLIDQDTNLWGDLNDLLSMTPGSAEELQLEHHMDDQATTMSAQLTIVQAELATCSAALGS